MVFRDLIAQYMDKSEVFSRYSGDDWYKFEDAIVEIVEKLLGITESSYTKEDNKDEKPMTAFAEQLFHYFENCYDKEDIRNYINELKDDGEDERAEEVEKHFDQIVDEYNDMKHDGWSDKVMFATSNILD